MCNIPHSFIPHFTLHSVEKIRIEFSTNYPLTTFRIPQNTPSRLQMKFSMSLFFYLITFAINLWHRKLSQQTSLQCLSTINTVFSDEDKILIKSLYLKKYKTMRLTDEFPEKSWTKLGV